MPAIAVCLAPTRLQSGRHRRQAGSYGSIHKPRQHRHRPLIVINCDKAENTLDRLLAAIGTHALDKYFHLHLEAGVANLDHAATQFD
ncbi:hypothetical protein ACEWB5_25860, partial [Citrobacter koseri]|uniref:hypothetical protein n=1 Tax=Citrobacter koseri TaxID=545 RepID=UPI003989A403